MTDWKLFASTYFLIFLAEIPDKTALAIVLLANRPHPLAVFWGVGLAFTVQCLIAVSFGSILGLLPHFVIHGGAALMFFVFAGLIWVHRNEAESSDLIFEKQRGSFRKTLQMSFFVIFIAEWGDLTQLATAALQAQFRRPLIIFASSALALWSTTGILVFLGYHSKKLINPVKLRKLGALAFAIVGFWMSYSAWKDYVG